MKLLVVSVTNSNNLQSYKLLLKYNYLLRKKSLIIRLIDREPDLLAVDSNRFVCITRFSFGYNLQVQWSLFTKMAYRQNMFTTTLVLSSRFGHYLIQSNQCSLANTGANLPALSGLRVKANITRAKNSSPKPSLPHSSRITSFLC